MNLKRDRNDSIHRNSKGRIAPNYQKIKEKILTVSKKILKKNETLKLQ